MVSTLKRLGPIFVLILGLISCNKQKVSSLRIPEPSWETAHGIAKFSIKKVEQIPVHSISDRLSFENSPPAWLRITARCRGPADRAYFQQKTLFELPAKVPLYSMLPAEALRPSSLARPLYCLLSFHAVNSNGSTHSFQTGDLLIQDTELPEGIEASSRTAQYNEDEFSQSEFRLNTSQAAEVKWLCDHMDATIRHPDHRYLALSEFQLPNDDKFRLYPKQNCRLAMVKNGAVTMISAVFSANFKPLTPVFESHPLSGAPSVKSVDAFSFRISNPTHVTLHLRIAPENAAAFTGGFRLSLMEPTSYCGRRDFWKGPVQSIHFKLEHYTGIAQAVEDAMGTSFTLSGQSHLEGRIELQFAPTRTPYALLIGTVVKGIKPIEVQSFSDDTWKSAYTLPWKIEGEAKFPNDNYPYPSIPCDR